MPTSKNPGLTNKLLRTLIIPAAILAAPTAGNCAAITWGTPVAITGTNDVITNGVAVCAYCWSGTNATVNGIAFAGTTSLSAAGTNAVLSGFSNNTSGAYTSTSDPFAALPLAYQTILCGGDYNSGAAVTVTLSNLLAGQLYEVQVWVSDPRGPYNSRTETVNGGGNTVTLAYSTGSGTTAGYPGEYTIGSFAASGTTESVTLAGNASSQLNALQVRNVTSVLAGNYWGGFVNGNWDYTTTNWGPGQTFAVVTNIYTSVYFADTNFYGNAVVNTKISAPSAGVAIATVNFVNNNVNYTITNAGGTTGITGPTTVVKSGGATVTLGSPNSYTGGTTVANGTLNISGNQSGVTGGWAIGTSANLGMTVNFLAGAVMTVASPGSIVLNETYSDLSGGAYLNVAGTVTNNGSLNVERAGSATVESGGAWTQTGSLTVGPNGSTAYGASLTVEGGVFTYAGTSAVGLDSSPGDSGSATLAIGGGGTFITGQPFENTTSSGTGSGNITLGATNSAASGPATLELSTNIATLVPSVGTGFNFQLGTGGGVIDTAGFSTTVSNGIGNVTSQSGSLTLTGPGTLTLAATNTYTGGTAVSNGTLVVAGNLGNSPVITVAGTNATLSLLQSTALTNNVMLVINAGGEAILASGVNQTAGTLCLGGQWEPDGTYGSTSSGAENQNNAYFAGAGMITVSHGTRAQSPGPLTILDYDVREIYGFDGDNPAPGVVSYWAFPGFDYVPSDYVYADTYNYQNGAGLPVSAFFPEQTNPLAGNTNANGSFMCSNSLPAMLSWFTNNPSVPLTCVLTDYEPYDQSQSQCNAEITNTVKIVRAATTTNASAAYVGDYAVYPGVSDPALSFASRIDDAAFYLDSGLNAAQPNAYIYSQYAANGPNYRSGYFYSDLELVSFVKLNLPAGHKLLPWVNGETNISDGDALLAHLRLRGVDGYCDLGAMEYQYYAWSDLDWLFNASGYAGICNLTTSEATGFQWSGYQVGPNFAFFFSNLGSSATSQNLPDFPGLPASSPALAASTHTELFFVNDPTCIASNTTIYLGRDGINHGLYANDTVTLVNPIQVATPGTNGNLAATVIIGSDISGGFTPTFSGTLTLSNNVTLQSLGTAAIFGGSIVCTGAVTTVGNIVLNSVNSYTGGTEVSSGNLVISNAAALGTGAVTIPKTGTSSGTLQLALTGTNTITNTFNGFNSTTFTGNSTVPDIENISGTNVVAGGLTVTGEGGNGVTVQADAGLLELAGTIGTTLTYRGVELNGAGDGWITGNIVDGSGGISFGVWKDGAGSWVLSGSNTYSGSTTINNGTLVVNGSIGGGTVTVSTNAILTGTGTVGGAVVLDGSVDPGGSAVGTLNTGGETWYGGGSCQFNLNNATNSSGWALLNINGSLNMQATAANPFTINLVTLTASNMPGPMVGFTNGSTAWTLATASGAITNFNPAAFVVNASAFSNAFYGTFSVGTNGNSLEVIFTDPPLVAPVLGNTALYAAGAFSIRFSGPSNQPYRVLASTNLLLPLSGWQVITGGVFSGGAAIFTDDTATNAQKFYFISSP